MHIPRRLYFQSVVVAAVTLFASAAEIAAQDAQPNFLLIVSDDQSWFDVGAYGNDVVQTPNIDRLADEGMRFDRAFTTVPMCAPSRASLMTGLYPVRNGVWPNHAALYPDVRTLPQVFNELGYRTALAGKKHLKPAEQFPFEYMSEDEAPDFLARMGDEDPFVLVLATRDAHLPWPAPTDFSPEAIDLPPYLVDTERTRYDRARYYQDIQSLDNLVGRTLDALESSGHEEDTVVVFMGDQGASFPFEKWCLYDGGIRAPFIVRWPGEVGARSHSDALVSFVDVLPTMLDIVGADAAVDFDGESFLPVLRQQTNEHHDAIFAAQTSRGIIQGPEAYPIRAVRTDRYKYIRNLTPENAFQNMITEPNPRPLWRSWQEAAQESEFAAARVRLYQHRPAEELYDLENDPWEMTNLAEDSDYHDIKAELLVKIEDWMERQGDEGLATEMAAVERQRANEPDEALDYVIEEENGGTIGPTGRSVTRTGSLGRSAAGEQGRNSVFVLELPALEQADQLAGAWFSFSATSPINPDALEYNADLYAIGIVQSDSRGITRDQLLADYYEGRRDAEAVLVQDDVLTPQRAEGRITISDEASKTLDSYLQTFYDDNPQYDGGVYLLLRLSPDRDPGAVNAGYRPLPTENGGKANDPALTIRRDRG